jgi:hypothetical protein
MTTDQQLDERMSRWLEAEAPSQLPERVLLATFERTRSARQQAGWQTVLGRRPMNRTFFALGGATAAIVLAVVGFAYLYGGDPVSPATPSTTPSPSPIATSSPPSSPVSSPTASPTPEGRLYVSERHGYSLQLPDESWFVTEHRGSWELGDFYSFDDGGVDRPLSYSHPKWIILINSQALPADMTFEQWIEGHQQAIVSATRTCRLDSPESVSLRGQTVHVYTWVCQPDSPNADEDRPAVEALMTHGARVYSLSVGRTGADPTMDMRAALDEWLERLEFVD